MEKLTSMTTDGGRNTRMKGCNFGGAVGRVC